MTSEKEKELSLTHPRKAEKALEFMEFNQTGSFQDCESEHRKMSKLQISFGDNNDAR